MYCYRSISNRLLEISPPFTGEDTDTNLNKVNFPRSQLHQWQTLAYLLFDHIKQFQLLSLPPLPILQTYQKFLETQWVYWKGSLVQHWISASSLVPQSHQCRKEEHSWDLRKNKRLPNCTRHLWYFFWVTSTWIIFFPPKIRLNVYILVNREPFFMLQTKIVQATPSFYLWKPGSFINKRSLPKTLNLKIGTQRHGTLKEPEFMVLVVNTTYLMGQCVHCPMMRYQR